MKHLTPYLSWLLVIACLTVLAEAPAPTAAEQQAILDQIEARLPGQQQETWQAIREEHAAGLAKASTEAAFYKQLNELLAKLKLSHFHIAPPSTLGRVSSGAGELGLSARLVEDRAIVTEVRAGSPAAKAGILPGWEIVKVDDRAVDSFIARLKRFPGTEVQRRSTFSQSIGEALSPDPGASLHLLVRAPDGQQHQLELTAIQPTGQRLQFGNLPPLYGRVDQRRLPGNLGYLRFNIFMLPLLGEIQQAVQALADTDGMILDLRGNPGGIGLMACPIAGLFVTERTTLGRSNLEGGFINFAVFPAPRPYTKPLVILVDETTGSTAEILAAGLQEPGRATIVGRPTMGAVLPSIVVELPDGSRLQYAIADFHTPDGHQLEGRGVQPDLTVDYTVESFGRQADPILNQAINHLKGDPE